MEIVKALPLRDGIRVLETGCGPGAMAREIANRIGNGHLLGIDRSAKATQTAITWSLAEIETNRLSFRQSTIETFQLTPDEVQFDVAVAV